MRGILDESIVLLGDRIARELGVNIDDGVILAEAWLNRAVKRIRKLKVRKAVSSALKKTKRVKGKRPAWSFRGLGKSIKNMVQSAGIAAGTNVLNSKKPKTDPKSKDRK